MAEAKILKFGNLINRCKTEMGTERIQSGYPAIFYESGADFDFKLFF